VTRIKEQVVEMLRDIPEDKAIYILEVLKGFKALYAEDNKNSALNEINPTAMGIFKKYANPDLISKEKDAWGEAVKENLHIYS